MPNPIIIFCDGACSNNPGTGGWACIVRLSNERIIELGGGEPNTTNNKMEMRAALEAFKFISTHPEPVVLYTDSNYLVKGITAWVFGWMKNNWRTAEGKEVANQELWNQLIEVSSKRGSKNIDWKHIPAHSGIPGNERVDEIAVSFSKYNEIELYDGDAKNYSVSLEVNPVVPKGKPYYLSLIDGVLEKHRTWSDCEKRVKGKSNTKFKKVSSPTEEKAVLKSWGLLTQ